MHQHISLLNVYENKYKIIRASNKPKTEKQQNINFVNHSIILCNLGTT